MSNDWFQPVPLFEGEDLTALQREFARLWARYPNRLPAEIGQELFKNAREPMRGLQAGAVWSRELHVLTLRDEFKLRNAKEVPEDFKKEVGRKAIETLMTLLDSDDEKIRLEAVKEATEIAGYKPKGVGAIVNNNVDNRTINVLRVPMRDSSVEDDADFNTKFKAQQTQLIADARSNRPN